MRKLLAVAGVEGDVDRLREVLEAEGRSVDAVALVGDLAAPWGPNGIYRDVFRLLGETGKPAFWVPGVNDAPVHDYLIEAFNLEVVFPSLHVVHGTFATAPGDLVFAGLGGEIVDDPDTLRAEEALLRYPGWEAEYRLRMLSELDEYPLVLLFATPPAHKGLGDPGSGVVAELIKTYSPRVAIVGGRDPKHELLGRSLVVCPGSLADGRYAVVDMDSSTVEQSQLPDRITVER
jgi:Icc-related predicted phosphoesterase